MHESDVILKGEEFMKLRSIIMISVFAILSLLVLKQAHAELKVVVPITKISLMQKSKTNLTDIVAKQDDEDEALVDDAVDDLEHELAHMCDEDDLAVYEDRCEDCAEEVSRDAGHEMENCLDDSHDNDLTTAINCCTNNGCTMRESSSGVWSCTCSGNTATAASDKTAVVTKCIEDDQQDETRDCDRDLWRTDDDDLRDCVY